MIVKNSTSRFATGMALGALFGIAGTVGASYVFQFELFGDGVRDRDHQIVESVRELEEVALLELGIQGMHEHKDDGADLRFLDNVAMTIPWTDRTTVIPYSFQAKLGIDGEDVSIEPTGEDSFAISIPAFVFIGHDAVKFATAQEDGGAFRWIAAKPGELELANEILNAEAQSEYIAEHEEQLKDQAKTFYSRIVTGIDPEVELTFEFQD